ATNGRVLEADYNSSLSKPLGPHFSRARCDHAPTMNLIDANAAHATTTRRRQTDGATDWQADATFEHASGSYSRTPCRAARARIRAPMGPWVAIRCLGGPNPATAGKGGDAGRFKTRPLLLLILLLR